MLAAVIDIGSNSVRLVMYQYLGHHAQPVFNDKVTCGLGRGLVAGSTLDREAKELTRTTIRRFRQLLDARKPRMVKVVATAAIRESLDGREFAAELSEILGYPVEVLSGIEEATYAAKGVSISTYRPEGLVVDLGGGSMELARLYTEGQVDPECSIPKGSLGFADYYAKHGQPKLEALLKKLLAPCSQVPVKTIYAVGGSFRAIASHHMKRHHYPLHIIHDYLLSRKALEETVTTIQNDLKKGEKLVGVEGKRVGAIIPACIILLTLMKHVKAKHVVFSSAGIREGALRMSAKQEIPYDPLIAMMQAIPKVMGNSGYVDSLHIWITDILPCSPQENRMVQAFCHVSEIATAVHPSYRAEFAFERMLATLGYGMTHDEQVMMALTLYHRYRAKLKLEHPALTLVSARQRHFAYAVGQLADLAYSLSAGCETLLMRYVVVRDSDSGRITVNARGSDTTVVPASAENWCEGLGSAINALVSRAI
jgi:exopolyphosphatase / guanosine-5'-triphosphate,3'-diphosphate pyrophosphatase